MATFLHTMVRITDPAKRRAFYEALRFLREAAHARERFSPPDALANPQQAFQEPLRGQAMRPFGERPQMLAHLGLYSPGLVCELLANIRPCEYVTFQELPRVRAL
jgi:hypothetical protein